MSYVKGIVYEGMGNRDTQSRVKSHVLIWPNQSNKELIAMIFAEKPRLHFFTFPTSIVIFPILRLYFLMIWRSLVLVVFALCGPESVVSKSTIEVESRLTIGIYLLKTHSHMLLGRSHGGKRERPTDHPSLLFGALGPRHMSGWI